MMPRTARGKIGLRLHFAFGATMGAMDVIPADPPARTHSFHARTFFWLNFMADGGRSGTFTFAESGLRPLLTYWY